MRCDQGCAPLGRDAENGFTLVEMMVALLIFALIAAAGVSLLNFSIRAQAAAATRLDDVASDRRMSALLITDLAQAVPRITRDTNGASVSAFSGTGGTGTAPFLRYVRAGWSNPSAAPRPSVQRVDLALVGGRLERQSYPMVDGAAPDPPQVLATNVASVVMRYRTRGAWSATWTPPEPDALPQAVEMTVTRSHAAPLTMLFLVGVAQ